MPKGKPAVSPAEKSRKNPTSMKFAIAAFCYHNCFSEEHPNSHLTKILIRDCKTTKCHLWNHRGWQGVTGGNTKAESPDPKQTKNQSSSIRR